MARLIERAGQLGVTPSGLLKRLIEGGLSKSMEVYRASNEKRIEPSRVRSLSDAFVRAHETWRMENCAHNERGICTNLIYDKFKDWSEFKDRLVERDGHHFIIVFPEICGECDAPVPSTIRLSEAYGCDKCGAKWKVALKFKCTSCGEKSWWGWWPKSGSNSFSASLLPRA